MKIFIALFFGVCLHAANNTGFLIAKDADRHIGLSYLWGGEDLQAGVDCSGFLQSLYKKYGFNIPRTAASQARDQHSPTIKNLRNCKIGDALYFQNEKGKVHHVAIVTGRDENGLPIITHAKGRKFGVVKERIGDHYIDQFVGAKRFYTTSLFPQKTDKKLKPLILKGFIHLSSKPLSISVQKKALILK
jgi:hypothetical protein